MSKPIKPAYTPEAPRYRVSPNTRCDQAFKVRQKSGKEAAPILAAARQTPQAGTKTVVDQLQCLEVHELVYPGNGTDIKAVDGKWVYVFDYVDKACILEAHGTVVSATRTQKWEYRAGPITPKSLKGAPELKSWSFGTINFPDDTFPVAGLCRVFLSPIRLTPRALEYLLQQMERVGAQGDRANPLVTPDPTPPNELIALVPDPFAWSQDASLKYYLPTLDAWVTWAQDPERGAKRFIAAQQKVWYESLKKQATDQSWLSKTFSPIDMEKFLAGRKSSGEAYLDEDTAENNKRQSIAEKACAYVVSCTDSHEHRTVEIACEETGGAAIEGALAHWGILMTGFESTAPGRDYLNELAEQTYRVPMRYVFDASPPSNAPDYKTSVAGRAGAAMILGRLGPSVMRVPSQNVGDEDGLSGVAVIADAANRVFNGWARFKAVASVIRATGTQDSSGDWNAAASGASTRRAVDVAVRFGTLSVDAVPGMKPQDAIDAGEVADAIRSNALGVLDKMEIERIKKVVLHLSHITDALDLASSIMAWSSKVSASTAIADGPFGIIAADPATALTVTSKGGQLTTSLIASIKGETELLKGLGSGFGYIGGLVETAGHSSKFGGTLAEGNYGQSVGHGMSTTGTSLSTMAAALGVAKALGGSGALIGAAGPIGVLGFGLVLVGAFIVRIFKKTPIEEYFERCFLGSKYGNDPVTGFSWIDEPLPMKSVIEQARCLLYFLSAFHVQRQGDFRPEHNGPPPVREGGVTWKRGGGQGTFADADFQRDKFSVPGSWIRVNLGHFPVGSWLGVQVKQRYVEHYDHDSELVGETGEFRFTHASPGVITRSDWSLGTLNLDSYYDYAVDGDTIRALRFPLHPNLYGPMSGPSVWNHEDMIKRWQAKNCLVKVRVNISDQKAHWRTMPYGSRWVAFDSVTMEEAHAMDPDRYQL